MFGIGGKKYKALEDHGFGALVPRSKAVLVVPNADPLPQGTCLGLWAAEDGTVAGTMGDGETEVEDFPVFKGWNPFTFETITDATVEVWAAY